MDADKNSHPVVISSCLVCALLAENVPQRRLSWKLQGPQECFDILVSAWNSAGEGPKGKPATCCCPSKLSYQLSSGAWSNEMDEKGQGSLKPSIVLWLT